MRVTVSLCCCDYRYTGARLHINGITLWYYSGLSAEGLYRVAGLHDEVEEIRMAFDKGNLLHIFVLGRHFVCPRY